MAETATLATRPSLNSDEPELDLTVQDILAHEKIMLAAALQHNTALLDKHIADDAILVYEGKQRTKRMYLAEMLEQPMVPAQVKSTHSNVIWKKENDVVEVTFTSVLSVRVTGRWKDVYESRGTSRYRKVDGEWVLMGYTSVYAKKLSSK